jgi:hypothetical protein
MFSPFLFGADVECAVYRGKAAQLPLSQSPLIEIEV